MTGIREVPAVDNNERLRDVIELGRFAEAVRSGRVSEVMTTSDFAHLADLVDRGVKAGYLNEEVPLSYPTLGWRRDSQDFRTARDYEINAAKEVPRVAEKGEYLPHDPAISQHEFTMKKYGWQWDLSWEAWLGDQRDLGLLGQYPVSWGVSTRYTRELVFTTQWAAHATFFTGAQGNLIDDVLDADGLAAGIAAIRQFTDPAGNLSPYMGPLYLVVPSALEFTAKRLVTSSVTVGGDENVPANNPMFGAASLVVNPFLDTLDSPTCWYLFCAPSLRPAVRYGYLRGYEMPEIFVKDSDARALMGGGDDPFAGSFLTDDIAFKLRFTFGTGLVDWRGALRSSGDAA